MTSSTTTNTTMMMAMEAANAKANKVGNRNSASSAAIHIHTEETLKYYCRVCTANPHKNNKKLRFEEQNVGIFKKIGLKSILEKFLHLEISEDDPLPKTICKKCFDKLMAIEFLQVVAKRSEQVFRDILTNKSDKKTIDDNYKIVSNIIPPARKLERPPEDVVVDITMSDPLTKDVKKKLQVAQSKRDSIGLAFSPENLNQNAVTSSPIPQVPVTIVHRMPKKRRPNPYPNPMANKPSVQIPPATPVPKNTTTVTLENPPRMKFTSVHPKVEPAPLRHISEAPIIPQNVEIHPVVTGNPGALGNGMPLGSIIKDVDLLKLILKALKWPYNNQTLDIQIQRLKNTNFNDIIVDPNLLQDTDLIQILGPLLNPLPVTMQQPTYHITIPPESLDVPPTTMSYKLPAETSVQIITVPASEKEEPERKHRPSKRHSMKHSVIRKKIDSLPRRKLSSTPVIILSDSDDENSQKTTSANEEIPNFGVQLDPAVYPDVGENSNSNEAMLATLNRQREAMMRMHRSKRKQSLSRAKNVEMVDDIMIVDESYHMDEPYPEVVLVKKSQNQGSRDAQLVASNPQSKSLTEKTSFTKNVAMHLKANPSTSLKMVQRMSEYSSQREKSQSSRKFVKLREDSHLPPLKKLKVIPAPKPNYVQKKENSIVAPHMSKNTTLADADSTTKIVVKDPKVQNKSSSSFEEIIPKSFIQKPVAAAPAPSDKQSDINQPADDDRDDLSEQDLVIVELEEFCDEEVEKEKPLPVEKKKTPSVPRKKTKKKSEFKIVGSFELSDDETRPSKVKKTEPKKTPQEQQAPTTAAPIEQEKVSIEKESSKESNDKEVPPKAPSESKEEKEADKPPAEVETPSKSIEEPKSNIKAEQNEDFKVKKEIIDSIDDGQPSKASEGKRSSRNFVGKTAIKTEVFKSTRSASKRKIVPKEEPMDITNFRPARKSKTMSKYYKGPPLSGTEGRSMRSRT